MAERLDLMADYTYLFADLRTDAIVAELPLDAVTIGRKLNGAGQWSARLPLADPRVRSLDPIGSTVPGRSAVYVDRDGVLVGGGIVWTRRTSSDADGRPTLELAGNEHWSYFARRLIRATAAFEGEDQAAIVAAIIATAQAATGGDIGVDVPAVVTDVLRDRTYYGYELKGVAEAVQQLAEVIDGFDFRIDLAWPGPAKTLVIGYPRLGVSGFETDLLFERPGNILDMTWPEDATRQATEVVAAGEGEGDDMLIAEASRADLIDDGWPLLEERSSYKDVRVLDTLQEHADADVDAAALPVTIPAVTVRGDVDPVVGTYDPGDDCRLVVVDDRFPDGIDVFARIVGFTIRPPADGALEQVTLELSEIAE